MPHAPSRQPLLHPLAAGALAAFTHPRCQVLRRVVRHADANAILAANGCIALRITRGPILFDDEIPNACPLGLARLDALPWARFQPDPNRIRDHEWRSFDAIRGDLYRHGLEELWIPRSLNSQSSTLNDSLTKAKPVWTAQAMLIPLALLQLVARLPRVELRIDRATDFALIRFAGGEGIIANRYRNVPAADIPAHIFSIFNPNSKPLPGGFSNP